LLQSSDLAIGSSGDCITSTRRRGRSIPFNRSTLLRATQRSARESSGDRH
jgi:hypothetical protein